MEFIIDSAGSLGVTDQELSDILNRVYVKGGFTSPSEAVSMFNPAAVRGRGEIIAAREIETLCLSGLIIVVPHDSPACRLAVTGEVELHLLGVDEQYRGQGLGRRLLNASVEKAREGRDSKILLWTQLSMKAAQQLYESVGFEYIHDIERNDRKFKLYERLIDPV